MNIFQILIEAFTLPIFLLAGVGIIATLGWTDEETKDEER